MLRLTLTLTLISNLNPGCDGMTRGRDPYPNFGPPPPERTCSDVDSLLCTGGNTLVVATTAAMEHQISVIANVDMYGEMQSWTCTEARWRRTSLYRARSPCLRVGSSRLRLGLHLVRSYSSSAPLACVDRVRNMKGGITGSNGTLHSSHLIRLNTLLTYYFGEL